MGQGISTCESEEASIHNFNEVKLTFCRLGIDVRIGVILTFRRLISTIVDVPNR